MVKQLNIDSLTFEKGMEALEEIVRLLETGNIPLEESFAAFEQGVAIQEHLKKLLDEGERKIQILTEKGITNVNEEE